LKIVDAVGRFGDLGFAQKGAVVDVRELDHPEAVELYRKFRDQDWLMGDLDGSRLKYRRLKYRGKIVLPAKPKSGSGLGLRLI